MTPDVIITAHGCEFAITERGRIPGKPSLTHAEVALLKKAAGDRKMGPEYTRALWTLKSVFPGAVILEAK